MDSQSNNPVQPQAPQQPPVPQEPQEFMQACHAVPLTIPEANFGELLQRHRVNDAELSLADAAACSHVAIGTLKRLETGDFKQINLGHLYCQQNITRLCEAYHLTEEETDNVLNTFEKDCQKYLCECGQNEPHNNLIKAIEDAAPKSRQSLSAILISFLSLFLVALIIGGFIYRTYQQSRLKGIDTDFDLPSIIEPQKLPLDVIPVPNS